MVDDFLKWTQSIYIIYYSEDSTNLTNKVWWVYRQGASLLAKPELIPMAVSGSFFHFVAGDSD